MIFRHSMVTLHWKARMTRLAQNPQMQIGQVDISKIQISSKSRDDISKLLKGLQFIYSTPSVRKEIFELLEAQIAPEVDKNNGRPGMELWKILVMGVLRLSLNCDYDRLHELVNQHKTIREMLGHADFFDKIEYQLQTIKDNVSLLTPELLDEINQVVVKAGHSLLKKSEPLRGRCDSFVVETDVHFPTDISLLFDAMRKIIQQVAKLCEHSGLSDWRQYRYNIKHLKRLMRIAQLKKRSKSKQADQQNKKDKAIKDAHQEYLNIAQKYLDKAHASINAIQKADLLKPQDAPLVESIEMFTVHADRQVDQIKRRILLDEKIPHEEKVFSVFQPHTEWIVKGKAGVPVELGMKVCVLEDQHQFILHHRVMENETDDKVAVSMVQETQQKFPELNTCSFDKGFHSKENQSALADILEVVALPRKGRLSKEAQEIEKSDSFVKAKQKHSAVESSINALEVHGLDQCLDHGIDGFKSYVGLAIVGKNIDRIGSLIQRAEQRKAARLKKRIRGRSPPLAA